MSLYKASPNDRFILGFAMVCYMNVLVCCQKALPNSQPPLAISICTVRKVDEGMTRSNMRANCRQQLQGLGLIKNFLFGPAFFGPFNCIRTQKMSKWSSFGVDMFFSNSWNPKKGEY